MQPIGGGSKTMHNTIATSITMLHATAKQLNIIKMKNEGLVYKYLFQMF
jgi:hypothetical protein